MHIFTDICKVSECSCIFTHVRQHDISNHGGLGGLFPSVSTSPNLDIKLTIPSEPERDIEERIQVTGYKNNLSTVK